MLTNSIFIAINSNFIAIINYFNLQFLHDFFAGHRKMDLIYPMFLVHTKI